MRIIDKKFHTDGDRIIKTSNGQAIPLDEPMFLLRARDHLALATLLAYQNLCIADGCTDYQLNMLHEDIATFKKFSEEHPERMKQPGCTRGL